MSNDTDDENGGDSTLTDLTLLDYDITGEFAELFELTGLDSAIVLGKGVSLPLEIAFSGTEDGEYTADLVFSTDQEAAYGEAGKSFTYHLYASLGGTVGSCMALHISPVPEPGTWALLAVVGLFAMGLVVRRK